MIKYPQIWVSPQVPFGGPSPSTPLRPLSGFKRRVTERVVFAFACQYNRQLYCHTRHRHPLLVEGRPNCARQSLATLAVAATSYWHPGRHANVVTPCLFSPCLSRPDLGARPTAGSSQVEEVSFFVCAALVACCASPVTSDCVLCFTSEIGQPLPWARNECLARSVLTWSSSS